MRSYRVIIILYLFHSSHQAQKARDNDIDVFTVGIGGAIDKQELKDIASKPDSRYVYTADNFESAQALANVLGPKICNRKNPFE